MLLYNRGGCLAKLQEMLLPDFLSHLQPCQPKYCQERLRSPKNGEHRMTPDHTSGLRSPQMGPQLRPGTIFNSQN